MDNLLVAGRGPGSNCLGAAWLDCGRGHAPDHPQGVHSLPHYTSSVGITLLRGMRSAKVELTTMRTLEEGHLKSFT